MSLLGLLLFPFAVLYDLVTRIRNHLYDIGQKPSFDFEVPVIVVGNLNVGGSGKTPMVEYLIRLLKDRRGVVTLSRGYKRRSSGFRRASDPDTAASIGDEPLLLFKKHGADASVTVAEDRAFAIPNILHEMPDTKVIILDDAFQHRSVRARLTILLTDRTKPFYADHVLPSGRLRESRGGARRADIVVITRCEEAITADERKSVTSYVQKFAGNKPVFFSTVRYDAPYALTEEKKVSGDVVLVSGIARPGPFENFCKSRYNVIRHFRYPDHHNYSSSDLGAIEGFCKAQKQPVSVITTEKDMVKLTAFELGGPGGPQGWFAVAIRQDFLEDGLKFDEMVLSAIAE